MNSKKEEAKIMKELSIYVLNHQKDFPDIAPKKLKEFKNYCGSPMLNKEIRDLLFIIDEYGTGHLILILKMILKPAYWQYIKLLCINDTIPHFDLYLNYYKKEEEGTWKNQK